MPSHLRFPPLQELGRVGDFENTNYQNVEISGIEVGDATSVDQSGEATVWLIGALMLIISLMGVAFYVLRRGGEDFYYGEEEWEEEEGEANAVSSLPERGYSM